MPSAFSLPLHRRRPVFPSRSGKPRDTLLSQLERTCEIHRRLITGLFGGSACDELTPPIPSVQRNRTSGLSPSSLIPDSPPSPSLERETCGELKRARAVTGCHRQ